MNSQLNDMLKGVDRSTIIKVVAIYLVIYAVVNVCGGIAFTMLGALSGVGAALGGAAAGAAGASGAAGSQELQQGVAALAPLGGIALLIGCVSLLSVPLFAAAAYGLYQRKRWSRNLTIVALVVTIVLSVLSLGSSGITSILWIAVSAFVAYLFYTDAEIAALLTN
jgi:hypothetical protein